jgi:membrane protein
MISLERLQDQLQQVLNKTVSVYKIARFAFDRMGDERVPEVSAGLAFYGFFSLFPLLLILVAFGGRFLESSEAQDQVLTLLINIFPFSGELVKFNIQQVLSIRGSVSTFSAIALAWSGSAAFAILARNINFAWPSAGKRPFFYRRMMALLIVVVMVLVMILLLAANTLTRLLPKEINGVAQFLMQLRYFSHFTMWSLLLVSLLTIYRWVPNTYVSWSQGAWGGFIASTLIEITTQVFTWYLRNGFINYSLVYGSLGAVAALLFWIYLIGFNVLFGAHLSAAIAQHEQIGKETLPESQTTS